MGMQQTKIKDCVIIDQNRPGGKNDWCTVLFSTRQALLV